MDNKGVIKSTNIHSNDSTTLYIALVTMVCVAAGFVAITFTIFLNSKAYKTVQDIQTSEKATGSSLGDYDTTSPVKSIDINETLKLIENKLNGLDNSSDYGPDATSDSVLGLER